MGMCSNKRSSASVAVWCVVLGLSLLVVDAAGKEGGGRAGHLAEEHGDAAYCLALCKDRSKSEFGPCYNECLYGRVTAQEEEARGGGGVGGRAGLLATPTERAGREEEEKRKQTHAVVRLTDPVWCYDACHDQDIMPYDQCVKEYCYDLPDAAQLAAHGGLGGEEARGVGADALTAAAAGRVAVGPCSCSGTGKVEACDYCCQREAFRDWNFDWDACIRCCDDQHSHPIKKEQEKNKDGVVPPAK